MKCETIGQNYLTNLEGLITTLGKSEPYYIRCFKPNQNQRPNDFDGGVILKQLRQSGTVELVDIMHNGFPNRMEYKVL